MPAPITISKTMIEFPITLNVLDFLPMMEIPTSIKRKTNDRITNTFVRSEKGIFGARTDSPKPSNTSTQPITGSVVSSLSQKVLSRPVELVTGGSWSVTLSEDGEVVSVVLSFIVSSVATRVAERLRSGRSILPVGMDAISNCADTAQTEPLPGIWRCLNLRHRLEFHTVAIRNIALLLSIEG